ncbi:selenium metabolism-associated LysR family transcriptional regulator [Desulfolucanica intricata]|uniref:selenium metabolism-associated LysR family transcriptional regulator n=1 Tax=Desulfolucanica intricata TaxID=1285191 RepID=UPI00082FDE6A|nr:selenium metabolism-associated LysR family transcriptional regulator [Desulfolucanica intricata]
MNTKQLEAFLLVAQHKSFTKAANQLMMTQPAVSFQIKSLEEELQITLFERSEKKVLLTEAGRLLYPVAVQMVRQYHKIRASLDDLRDLKTGHLQLGANLLAGEVLLPRLIGAFREHYPGVSVSLRVGGSSLVQHWLKEREVDLGILSISMQTEGIEGRPWLQDHLVLITPPWHSWNGVEISMSDLYREPLIVRESGSGTRQVIEQQLSEHNISLEQFPGILELGSTQSVINAVNAGLGIGMVSAWAAREPLEAGKIGKFTVPGLKFEYNLYLAWNRNNAEGLAVSAFISFLTDKEITTRFLG